jgi:hypothetical protein
MLRGGNRQGQVKPNQISGASRQKGVSAKKAVTKTTKKAARKSAAKKSKQTEKNRVYNQQRRLSENQRSRDSESSYPRFPSIVGALIIAASILLSTLIFAAGTRFIAVETPNEDATWLVDRLSGNLYKCRAAEQGKATCEAETATRC